MKTSIKIAIALLTLAVICSASSYLQPIRVTAVDTADAIISGVLQDGNVITLSCEDNSTPCVRPAVGQTGKVQMVRHLIYGETEALVVWSSEDAGVYWIL